MLRDNEYNYSECKEVDLSIMILRALLSANAVEVANLNNVREGGAGVGARWGGGKGVFIKLT